MTGVISQEALLNGVVRVAEFGANWMVQSTLLLSVGFSVAWLLRTRGAAVQSAVYRTTLVAVLVCPPISWMLALAGASGFSIDLLWEVPTQRDTYVALAGGDAGMAVSVSEVAAGQLEPQSPDATALPVGYRSSSGMDADLGAVGPALPASNGQSVEPAAASEQEQAMPAPHRIGPIAAVLCLSWLAVAATFLARIASAWRQLLRIRRSATPADAATLAICREAASSMEVAVPEVRHSPYIPSPCLAGLQHPVVLLPEAYEALSLRDTLIHELAHLRRRDCHWSLLARLATAVLFFQPLLWMLCRRLDATAEEVCDDFVVQLGGDRHEYAHRLLDLAAFSGTPVASAALGIVSHKSMLARRVARITDLSRHLSTRTGRILLLLVLVGGLLVTTATGLVGVESQKSAEAAPAATASDEVDADNGHVVVHGRVIDADGKSVAGAHVAAVANQVFRVREDSGTSDVLAEATTDQQGEFTLRFAPVSSRTHRDTNIIVRVDGKGLAWQEIGTDATNAEISLTLPPEVPIRGRFVDPDGKGLAGIRLPLSITPKVENRASRSGLFYRFENPPAAWLPVAVSDESGRFTIRGVPADCGVHFEIEGNERVSPQDISLNTGAAEERGEFDGTYRAQVKNVGPEEEAVLTLAPAKFFEGVVRYEDTGKPAPHVKVSIWASQQEFAGSMTSVFGETDADGKYRICPKPGVRFGVEAYPPTGEPYFSRQIRDLRFSEDNTAQQLDISLPRGVLARGKVIESGAATPVVNAAVQYLPEKKSIPDFPDDVISGWQTIQRTNERGEFSLTVSPGPGRLLVHGRENEYVIHETSSREVYRGVKGRRRVYAHSIVKIDPPEGSEPIDLEIQLERSPAMSGELVDEEGAPVDGVLMVTRLNIHPHWIEWGASPRKTKGGKFEIAGLAPGKECPVFFLHPERQIGATVLLRAGDEPQRVVLRPCGQATMRFVDTEGKPIANLSSYQFTTEMIVTPGVSKFFHFNWLESKLGLLEADAEFPSNIDRINHRSLSTDEQGKVTLPALIPGATYSIAVSQHDANVVARNFVAKAGETLDLGDIVRDRPN